MRHFKTYIRLFQLVEVGTVITMLVLFVLSLNNLDLALASKEIGEKLAQASVIMLAITLTPGILRRLNLWPQIVRTLMPIRRHLGITMFIFGLGHSTLSYWLDQAILGKLPPQKLPQPFVLAGIITVWILLPLFLTSNDYAVRWLKRRWQTLHRLIYLSILTLLLHLALQSSIWSLLALFLLILEIISWGKKIYTSFSKNVPKNTQH